MATKKNNAAAPPADGTQAQTELVKPTKKRANQPEWVKLEIERVKTQVGTLKLVGKVIVILEKMDEDGRKQVEGWIAKQREAAQHEAS